MPKELISVVMTVYKEPIYMIKESIESILNQTYNPIETIVIVDNPKNTIAIDFLKTINGIKLIVTIHS